MEDDYNPFPWVPFIIGCILLATGIYMIVNLLHNMGC